MLSQSLPQLLRKFQANPVKVKHFWKPCGKFAPGMHQQCQ